MTEPYAIEDVRRAYQWFSHPPGWTELFSLHPEYKRGDSEWNTAHHSFPRVWYTRSEKDVVRFVERYAPARFLMWGVNPRPRILRNGRNFARGARDEDIEVCQTVFFDFDFEGETNDSRKRSFEEFLDKADQYFLDLGMRAPVRSFSGAGYHLYFALPPINVHEHPDIGARLRLFREQFADSYKHELAGLDAKLDSTVDLKRTVRVPGTAKVGGVLSEFYGTARRVKDEALREYLLNLELPEHAGIRSNGSLELKVANGVPRWFSSLLERDNELRHLWSGNGKQQGDATRSGYDFSLVKKLLWLGYTDIGDLAAILAARPEGSVQKSGKDEPYIRQTIASALTR